MKNKITSALFLLIALSLGTVTHAARSKDGVDEGEQPEEAHKRARTDNAHDNEFVINGFGFGRASTLAVIAAVVAIPVNNLPQAPEPLPDENAPSSTVDDTARRQALAAATLMALMEADAAAVPDVVVRPRPDDVFDLREWRNPASFFGSHL